MRRDSGSEGRAAGGSREGGEGLVVEVLLLLHAALSAHLLTLHSITLPTHTHRRRGISGMCRSLLLIHLHVSLSLHPSLTAPPPRESATHHGETCDYSFLEIFALIVLEPRVGSNPLTVTYVAC